MGSMYSQILKDKKEDHEKYSVLRRQCPQCKHLMHRYDGGWWCTHCYKKYDFEGKEITHETISASDQSTEGDGAV